MKRFVTYLYQYDRGTRCKNIGFIKADVREYGCRMEIQVRGLDSFNGRANIYFIICEKETIAVSAGELVISQGKGGLRLTLPRNQLGKSTYHIEQISAIIIRYGSGKILASCWRDIVPPSVFYGNFKIWEDNPDLSPMEAKITRDDSGPEDVSTPEDNSVSGSKGSPAPEDTPVSDDKPASEAEVSSVPYDNPVSEDNSASETEISSTPENNPASEDNSVAETKGSSAPENNPASEDNFASEPKGSREPEDNSASETETSPVTEDTPKRVSYRKIAIADIRSLPKKNWYLSNNSFLIHGFFNYHYLLLKIVEKDNEKQFFLGVPGIYEQPEYMMALLFGFPDFEPAQGHKATSETGVFGYWMTELLS